MRDDLQIAKEKLSKISLQLQHISGIKYNFVVTKESLFQWHTDEIIANKREIDYDLNTCRFVLSTQKEKLMGEVYESEDFKVNADSTDNVTIVFVVGEAAIRKAINLATHADRAIDVNCCVEGI